jgi:predicted acyl esterase
MNKEVPMIKPLLPAGIKFEENIYVTMRDGIKIAVDIYRPEKEGRYPALVSTSGYLKSAQLWAPELNKSIEAGQTLFFVPKGYVHIIYAARGSGFSQGQYNWYDETEQKDAAEVIEWAAKQPWCSGNIGLLGDSYFSRIQFLIAAQQPPHLKCIVPFNGGMDDYRSRHEGGVIRLGWLSNWAADVISQCTWPGPIEGKLQPTNLIAQVCEHPDDGPWYWERSGYKKADKIKAPVLSIVVGESPLHSPSQLAGWNALKSPKKMVVLPFCPMNVLELRSKPINEYMLRWYDHWLKGIDTGIMDEPQIAICDSLTGEWRYEDEYPLKRTQWTKYYLRSNPSNPSTQPPYGLLSLDPPKEEEPDYWITPDCMPLVLERKPVCAYISAPLEQDTRIWGPISLTIYGSSTTLDTAWFAKIGDVSPEGKLSAGPGLGVLRASYREIDPSRSTPGVPFHPFQNPQLPEPGKVYEYQIALCPIFRTFKKGHKIWIQIASDDYMYMGEHFTVYNAYEMLPIPARNTIFHDVEHLSHILLPVVPDSPVKKPVAAPLSQVKWPMGDTAMRFPYDG